MPTGSSLSITYAPEAFIVLRTSACAQTAPNRPVLAPMTAVGLERRTFSGNGRDAQSIAFLSEPGSEALYSGVAISSASAPSTAAKNARTGSGGVFSRSSSKAGRVARPSHSTSSVPGGSSAAAARRSLRLWDPRRRLPEMPRIRTGLGLLDEGDVDRQRDVVGQRVAAGRQRHVPVEAELRAVDRRVELQVRAGVAERVLRRGLPGARGGDRLGDAADREVAADRGGRVVVERHVGRGEVDRRVVLDVEELGAEDVRAELLRSDDRDRLDLRGALELAVGERRGDLAERAAEHRDVLVLDGEAERRMNRIGVEGAGEGGGGAHGCVPPVGVSLPVTGGCSGYAPTL